MRILMAGAELNLGKAFIKAYKKTYELVALDLKKEDFSNYMPIREIFKAYAFDAVLYVTAEGRVASAETAGDLNLFKNLRYAAAFHNVPKMVTVLDADETAIFNAAGARIAALDPFGTALKLYGLFGKGVSVKVSPIMRILSDANKTGAVTFRRERNISAVHIDDAVKLIAAALDGHLPRGVYDVAPYKTSYSGIARAAKKILGTPVTVTAQEPEPAPDYTGDKEPLAAAIKKFKFTPFNGVLERVLGDV
jgi:dTDP-4-dehydrorhamnose reductase